MQIPKDGSIPDLTKLNFVILIQDIFEHSKETIEKEVEENEFDAASHLRDSRIAIVSAFLEVQQDVNKDDLEKVMIAFFYRNLLVTFTAIYGFSLMDGQTEFVEQLRQYEDYMHPIIKQRYDQQEQLLLANQINKEPTTPIQEAVHSATPEKEIIPQFELSPTWGHGIDKLNKLSLLLVEDGFTNDINTFKNIFDKTADVYCEWQKAKTSLLYLIGMLFSINDTIPDVIINVICSKVRFNGKKTSKHSLQTQLSHISHNFSINRSKLKGQYAEIYTLYASIF